jgi:L-lactate dehydrogenase complex protein LldF
MHATSSTFKHNAHRALIDSELQHALNNAEARFTDHRAEMVAQIPDFDAIRDGAVAIKNHTLAHLDLYLETYERAVTEAGGEVHWAATAADAREIVLSICARHGASAWRPD